MTEQKKKSQMSGRTFKQQSPRAQQAEVGETIGDNDDTRNEQQRYEMPISAPCLVELSN